MRQIVLKKVTRGRRIRTLNKGFGELREYATCSI
nr:MAG TPA: transcription factor E2-alpha [Caudoviricetes sp.]